ncbi:MAG: hypothetical protein KC550_04775, partial [Nanoarchaeota archaeon]|nr:hypothetical protein [Nanoarchaeota archaeon]
QSRSNIYTYTSSGLVNYGRLDLRVGPDDRTSGVEYQRVNQYFWIDGIAAQCGNGNLEAGEACDDGNLVNGDGCNDRCLIEPAVKPIISWLNYETSSDLWRGRNMTPGENITLFYKIYNPNLLHNMTVAYESLLYTEPYNMRNSNGWYRYDGDYTLNRYSVNQTLTYYVVPINSSIIINKTFVAPDYSQLWQDVLERFHLLEMFTYKKTSQSGGTYFPRNPDGSTDYDWWQTDSNMTTHSSWWGSGWYKRGWGFGSYSSQYSIYGLEPNNPTLAVTTNDEGIPAIEVRYHHGTVRASYMKNISSGTFFLKGQLKFQNNTVLYNQNYSIDKFYKRNDGYDIQPYEEYRWWYGSYKNELAVDELISFPLYNFDLVNGKFVKFDVRPYINKTGRPIVLHHVPESDIYPINLNLIKMSVDSPLNIKPRGSEGYDELYGRIVMFNYYEYSIFGAKIDVEFRDTNNDLVSGLFEAEYINQSIIPAGAAYPIGIKVRHIGPNPTFDKDYKMVVKLSYYDWLLNETKEVRVEAGINLYDDIVNTKFVDLIPMGLNYTLVNINNESLVTVMVANQGTEDAGVFPVEFYTKTANETSFTLIDTKTLSLNKGEMKTANFTFIPTSFEKMVLKVVINGDDSVFENDLFTNAHDNNVITSITAVRDIDVVLEYLYPDYDNAIKGIIPFKVFARNKGVGGIDEYELRLNITGEDGHNEIQSYFFQQIPQAGVEFTFYMNVTELPPQAYRYRADLYTLFDPDLSDNFLIRTFNFCPLPWYSSPLDCHTICSETCLNKLTNRYMSTCNGINGCNFQSDAFAQSCNGYLVDSYAPYNATHDALCAEAKIILQKRFSLENLNITGDCDNIEIDKSPSLINGEAVNMLLVKCINNPDY